MSDLIKYRNYIIHETGFYAHPDWRKISWSFYHEDYDGAPDGYDRRYGVAESIDACKAEIDEQIADEAYDRETFERDFLGSDDRAEP